MPINPTHLTNRFYTQNLLTVDKRCKDFPGGPIPDIGVTYRENGDTLVCLYAPEAGSACLTLSTNPVLIKEISLTKHPDGAFRGVIPFDEGFTGPINAEVRFDGTGVLTPYLPIIWTNNRPYNMVEVPDPEDDYLLVRDVPHGAVGSQLFWSEAMGNWQRCMVYTPAGYMNGKEEYPVLYLQNGGSDNETSWDNVGRVSNILDNLIADGEAVPFIVVMNNAQLREGGEIRIARDKAYETMLLQDCIPFIEQNYRVKAGKWNRAIGGLSMGAYMTCDIAFSHPDVFGYMGTFTASMTQSPEEEQAQYTVNGLTRPYYAFLRDTSPARFAEYFKVYFRSTTPQENHPEFFAADDGLLEKAGYTGLPNYTRILYPERTSKWNSWRMGLRDYAKLLFR